MSEQRKPRMITRREMLKLTGLTGVSLLASACVVTATACCNAATAFR